MQRGTPEAQTKPDGVGDSSALSNVLWIQAMTDDPAPANALMALSTLVVDWLAEPGTLLADLRAG